MLKSKLADGKTLSIAAPASFWYLKAFPIKEIAKIVDFIVYMTYDLHGEYPPLVLSLIHGQGAFMLTSLNLGQWDYDNPWASDGCPAGNCLHSHSKSHFSHCLRIWVKLRFTA